jgi:hypothetical protein
MKRLLHTIVGSWAALLLLLFFFLSPALADAQCAMCNETARTSTDGHQENAVALNNGILYLMAIPYILLGTIGFLWWKLRRSPKSGNTVSKAS